MVTTKNIFLFQPMCDALLRRKRKIEQDFRSRFNTWNDGITDGESLLMEKLAIEYEREELRKLSNC